MPETNYDKALDQALKRAYDSFQAKDLKEVCFKSGATDEGNGLLTLSYLNRTAIVNPGHERTEIDSQSAGTRETILILHYLLQASGTPLTGQMVGFKDIPQGGLYFQPFRNRVLLPMNGILKKNLSGFKKSVKQLGGEQIQSGDYSCRFRVFPYVTAQYIWYKGEEGIPSDLNLLFDASVPEYLSTEDVVVMCEELNRSIKSLLPRTGM